VLALSHTDSVAMRCRRAFHWLLRGCNFIVSLILVMLTSPSMLYVFRVLIAVPVVVISLFGGGLCVGAKSQSICSAYSQSNLSDRRSGAYIDGEFT